MNRMSPLADERTAGRNLSIEVLVKDMWSPLHGFFLKRIRDAAQAENLCQETFLRITRSFHTLRDGPTVRAWVFSIASNLYRDFLKTEARAPRPGSWLDEEPATQLTPEEAAENKALSCALAAAVGGLPEKHRQVFLLKHSIGLTYAEIGAKLGISEGTVKSRMHKAVHVVRDRLVQRGYIAAPRQKGVQP